MNEPDITGFLKMDNESFGRLSAYVTRTYGIKLPVSKKTMLESRLNKKVKTLGLSSYTEFLDFIFSEQGRKRELLNVIDLITTNKTDFFREAAHFHFLSKTYLPAYSTDLRSNLNIWSAGCSTGEEPYTLLMIMEEYKKQNPDIGYSIMASDVSIRAIQTAYQGIYELEKTDPVPLELKRKYFLRSKSDPTLVRIRPEYRRKIQFRRINLMDKDYGMIRSHLDFIFCRNVLIYFDKLVQEQILRRFCTLLKPGGLLFLGHSESIIGMNMPLKQVQPTVYRLDG